MISFYVPVRVGASARPNAVFEVYFPYEPIAAGIARDTRMLAVLLALGLLGLWISIFRLVAASLAAPDAAGQAGRADRAPEPRRASRRRPARAAGRAALGHAQRAAADRPRPLQGGQRHARPRPRRRAAARGRASGCARHCARATRSRGSAATSSRSCCATCRTAARSPRSRRRIQDALERPFELCGVAVELGASIGVALHPDHGDDLTTLLRRADVAMYDAKTPPRRRAHLRRRRAIPTRPSASRSSASCGARSSATSSCCTSSRRSRSTAASSPASRRSCAGTIPSAALIPPVEFVPLAERTGMIGAVTDWVLASALLAVRALARGRASSCPSPSTSPAPTCSTRGWPSASTRRSRRAGLPGDMLQCEISEDTVLGDPQRAIASLGRLRSMGVRLSLDDFGTGQSSMSYLKRLPLDQIKIDRSFVMGMSADESDAAIVRTTIDLGRNLGLEVVAEGVETDEVLSDLAALRCDVAQGFGLSRPLPADELERWLDARGVGAAALTRPAPTERWRCRGRRPIVPLGRERGVSARAP